MNDNMASVVGALNPEPSLPAEREKQHLPPKTYEQAVEENLSSAQANGDPAIEVYAGQGENESPRKPHRHAHKKTSSMRLNGSAKEKESPLAVERYTDKDGEHLVSLRRGLNRPRRTNSELVSGKKAGERWQQSP